MTPTTDLERRLASWLEDDGPVAIGPRVVDAALARATGERQLPAWRVPDWWRSRLPHREPSGVDREVVEADFGMPRTAMPVAYPWTRLAWVLVALLALLALFGGLLGAGGWLRATTVTTFACPPGTDPEAPGPVDQARPPSGMLMRAEWAGRGRIVTVMRDSPPWEFDVCANTWHAPSDQQGPRDGPTAYDEGSDLLVALSSDGVWARDADGTWTMLGTNRRRPLQAAYDPQSDLVIARDGYRNMWTYDPDTDTWHDVVQRGRLPPTNPSSGYQLVVFDVAAERLVLLDGSRSRMTWLFDPLTSSWAETTALVPVSLFIESDEIVYDATAGRALVYAADLGAQVAFAHDLAGASWEPLFHSATDGAGPPTAAAGMAWDPVNERLVVLGGVIDATVDDWAWNDGVSAFDPLTRVWTQLLAPTAGGAR